jgi:tRNA(fMet)-specific endonuclease VapC
MNFLLDTNILVYVSRARSADRIIDFLAAGESNLYISVVSVAEIRSLSIRNSWGEVRNNLMESFWERVNIVEIQSDVNAYAQIDSYSQRLNPNFSEYPFATPRNMGKNDLWIASLAAILNLELITTDADFDHLNNVFFPVRKFNPADFHRFAYCNFFEQEHKAA